MKIVHIITSLKVGGAETALYNMLKHMRYYNDRHVVIFFYNGSNVEKVKKLGIKTYKIKGFFSVYDPLALYRLYRLVKNISPNIIHTALWSANIVGRILAKILGVPLICDLHGRISDQGVFRNFFERITATIPKKLVAVSESVKKTFEEEVVDQRCSGRKRNMLKAKLTLIQNGVDIEDMIFQASKSKLTKDILGFQESDFIVGSVGRLDPIKSYDVLLRAFSLFLNRLSISKRQILRKPRLCLIGGGSEEEKLKLLTEKLKITSSVYFAGERENVFGFYPLFDCFVLSSKSEGLSIALLEAVSFGLPLISTHDFADHDIIKDGREGFLIPTGDVLALSKAILTLYESPELVASMSQRNAIFARQRFDIRRVVYAYNKLYQEIFSSDGR